MREEKEFILCAAIYVNDGQKHEQQPDNIDIGFVICGRRHHNCYQTIKDLIGEDVNSYFKKLNYSDSDYRNHQGFITSLDRFVSRKEGWIIAKANNQIQYGLKGCDIDERLSIKQEDAILISENLY